MIHFESHYNPVTLVGCVFHFPDEKPSVRTCSRSNGEVADMDASAEVGLCGSSPLETPYMDSSFAQKDFKTFSLESFPNL